MRAKFFKKLAIVFFAVVFCLVSALALAAAKQWVVVKDKKGNCKVIETTKGKTPKTIAGPFATKDEAQKAKAEKCPKPEKKKK